MKLTILASVICSLLLGCGQRMNVTDPSLDAAFTNVANSYFRLGVNAGQNVNLRHRIAGEPESYDWQLVNEAIVAAGTNVSYLLPLHP